MVIRCGNYGNIPGLLRLPRVVCRPHMVTHDRWFAVNNKDNSLNSWLFKAFDFSWVSGLSSDNRSFLSAYFVKVNQNSQRLSQNVCWKKVKKAILLWRCSAISTTLHVLILRVDCRCHGSLAQYVKSVRWPNGVITYLHHFATNHNHFITTIGIEGVGIPCWVGILNLYHEKSLTHLTPLKFGRVVNLVKSPIKEPC